MAEFQLWCFLRGQKTWREDTLHITHEIKVDSKVLLFLWGSGGILFVLVLLHTWNFLELLLPGIWSSWHGLTVMMYLVLSSSFFIFLMNCFLKQNDQNWCLVSFLLSGHMGLVLWSVLWPSIEAWFLCFQQKKYRIQSRLEIFALLFFWIGFISSLTYPSQQPGVMGTRFMHFVFKYCWRSFALIKWFHHCFIFFPLKCDTFNKSS